MYVADRENHRVQVFDGNGKYETQWNNLHRPCGALLLPRAQAAAVHHRRARAGPAGQPQPPEPRAAPVASSTSRASCIARLGGEDGAGTEAGKFIAPHGIALDSRGDIYVGEVSYTNWPQSFPDKPMPGHMRSLQKLAKVA